VLSGVTSIVLSLYCLTLPDTPPRGKENGNLAIKAFFRNTEMLVIFISVLLITIPSSFYYSFMSTYLSDKNIAFPATKMSIGQLSEIGVMLFLQVILIKFRWTTVLALGFLLWGVRYLLLVDDSVSEGTVWCALGLHGFAYCFGVLTAQMYVDKVAPVSIRSTAQGLFSFVVMGIGTTLGSMIAGWSVDAASQGQNTDWPQVWLVSGCIGILTCLMFLISRSVFKMTS
jgi:hypothetical protein